VPSEPLTTVIGPVALRMKV